MKNFCIVFLFFMVLSSCSHKPKNGDEIIQMMYDKYHGQFFKNMSFEQTIGFYDADSLVEEQTWLELMQLPGNLIVKYGGFESGYGTLFTRDSMFVFEEGNVTQKVKNIHYLLLMGFDVYHLSPESTISKTKELQIDLTKVYETRWHGEKAWVTGTEKENLTLNQFWVDKKNGYLVRFIRNNQDNIDDVELNQYKKFEGHWVATEIIFKRNGKLITTEHLFNIKFPSNLNDSLFNPEYFYESKW